MKRLLFLQLNELDFNTIARYAAQGSLPNFAAVFDRYGFVRTRSEKEHALANPWIQWPTVHTGLDYKEHGVFRLGDIVNSPHPHIYEVLEQHGISVAALSPFNARNNTHAARFFVPDPWTKTGFTGSTDLLRLYRALGTITDNYASGRMPLRALVDLALGALPNLRPASIPELVAATSAFVIRREKWQRAIVCDRLLADAFIHHWNTDKPDFATLFLNGGAHLQHHYLFSSAVYEGERRNPDVPAGADPLLDILRCYDHLLGELLELTQDHRLVIATALHQVAHERETWYYRIDDHAAFLQRIGLPYADTYRLMTEDFVIRFPTAEEAARAENKLAEVHSTGCPDIFYMETGDSDVRTQRTWSRIFHIENRGDSLYVQLRPTSAPVHKGMVVQSGNTVVDDFSQLVSLAQYKNTHHVGTGFYVDTGFQRGELPEEFPLKNIFDLVLQHFRIDTAATLKRPVPEWLMHHAATPPPPANSPRVNNHVP